MEETNAFDTLVAYARNHNFEFDTHDDYKRFYFTPNDPISDSKFVIFRSGELIFYAYDSYSAKMYSSNTFTGNYSVAPHGMPGLKVYSKDFTDAFLRSHKRKTGHSHIDEKLTITSETKDIAFFLSPKAVSDFLMLARRFPPLHLVVEYNYLHNIDGLKDKNVIGLETGQWLYKEEDVDLFLKAGGGIINTDINLF